MSTSLQHASLVIGMFHLFHLDNLCLLQHLDSIKALIMLRLHQMDTSERASAESALDIEVG